MGFNRFILLEIRAFSTNKIFLTILLLAVSYNLFSQDVILSPPSGFDKNLTNIAHGKTEVVSYYSSTVGINRKTRIYLPPGYTKDSTYNVLYLLHGIGGDINEWYNQGSPNLILDNLYAQNKIAPMIVVLPNGRAMVDDSPGSNIYAADKVAGFANFEFELIKDLIPFIDTTYSVKPGREARAIAGLSMGAGQSLNIGLAHLNTFAWIGAFSPAPNTKAANTLIPNLADTSKISTLWISCGDADGLFYISQNTHNFLVQNNINHYYLVEPGKGHDWSVWKPGLYHFTQRIFGKVPEKVSQTGFSEYSTIPMLKIAYKQNLQTITFSENKNLLKISIYDITGKLKVEESNFDNSVLDVSSLNNGIYLIFVVDGAKSISQKFIKF